MRKELIEKNLIVKLSLEFALDIIAFCEELEAQRKFIIARQLLKSGTSIGANIMEAQNAESRADFIHKFKLAAKEAAETEYWLLLCQFAKNYPASDALLTKIDTLNKVIARIIINSKSAAAK